MRTAARAAALSISMRPLLDGEVKSRRAVRVVHHRQDMPDHEHAFTSRQGAAAVRVDKGGEHRAFIIDDADFHAVQEVPGGSGLEGEVIGASERGAGVDGEAVIGGESPAIDGEGGDSDGHRQSGASFHIVLHGRSFHS